MIKDIIQPDIVVHSVEIRKAEPGNIDRIKQIDHLSKNPDRASFIEKAVSCGTAFVAVLESAVAACAVLDRSFFERPTISMLIVETNLRRRGIGNQLVEYLEGVCDGAEIWTSTNQSNTPMQHLLNNRGYHPTGFIHNLDPGDPELIYFKKL